MTARILWAALVLGLALFGFGFPAWAGEADQGRELYLQYCSSCHGKDGRGNGAVSSYLKIKIPDLTVLRKNNKGIYPMARVMTAIDGSRTVRAHGEPTMPVWGEVFEKEVKGQKYPHLSSLLKVKVIAEYISTLQR
jgi:mono/diheme cytochrome c family protein